MLGLGHVRQTLYKLSHITNFCFVVVVMFFFLKENSKKTLGMMLEEILIKLKDWTLKKIFACVSRVGSLSTVDFGNLP